MPAINSLFPRRLRTDWRSSAEALHLSRQSVCAPPQDFEFWRASESVSDHWTVVRDGATDSVSIQRSDGNRDLRSSLAVSKTWSTVNPNIRARFKLIDGSMQSAGIAVRVTSPNDYCLVRVSAFELRLSLLHVVNGTPKEIAGVDADVTQNHWQSLEVVVNGNCFKMSLDERWALTAFDYGKPVGGPFGIWTERDDVRFKPDRDHSADRRQ